jgi:hypothetical protein
VSSSRDRHEKSDNAKRADQIEIEGSHIAVGNDVQVSSVSVPIHVHVHTSISPGYPRAESDGLTDRERELITMYRAAPFEAQALIRRTAQKVARQTFLKFGRRTRPA